MPADGRTALSRWDNTTAICPRCGKDEAIDQHAIRMMFADHDMIRRAEVVSDCIDPVKGITKWWRVPRKGGEDGADADDSVRG